MGWGGHGRQLGFRFPAGRQLGFRFPESRVKRKRHSEAKKSEPKTDRSANKLKSMAKATHRAKKGNEANKWSSLWAAEAAEVVGGDG